MKKYKIVSSRISRAMIRTMVTAFDLGFFTSSVKYMYVTIKPCVAKLKRQECISVGCVPPAAVAVVGVAASVHAGIHRPGCRPGYPLGVGLETPSQLWAWRPPWVWAWRPPGYEPGDPSPVLGLETPLDVGLGTRHQTPRRSRHPPPGADPPWTDRRV